MDERVLSFRVGVVVVTAAIISVILILLFGAVPQAFTPTYDVTVRFPRAPGVAVNTPVRKSGVVVGRVSGVELLEEGGVLLTLRLDKDKPVRLNEYPRISTGSLVTGDAIIEFIRNEADPKNDLLKDGDFLPNGLVVSDPFEVMINLEDRMARAFTSIEDAATRASRILENLQWVGTDRERFDRILSKTETALEGFNNAISTVNNVIGDDQTQEQLRQGLAELPKTLESAKNAFDEARRAMEQFGGVAEHAGAAIENIEKFSDSVRERGPRIVASIEGSTENLDRLLAELVHLSESINERKGTLGKLVYEDDIYVQLGDTVENVNEITNKLNRIMNDLRVFSDKISRDPSQLGVRGALERRPTGAGFKGGVTFE